MDKFIDWATGNAPWLLPLLFVLALTFLIVPAAAQNGYERIIGYNPRFATKPGAEVRLGNSIRYGAAFVAPTSFKSRDDAPRLTLWSETLGAALGGDTQKLLITLVLASLSITAAVMHRLGGSPLYLPAKYLPVLFVLGCALFLWLLFGVLRPVYTAPLAINGIGERLSTPGELQDISGGPYKDVTALYSWLHGVDPKEGHVSKSPDWTQLRHLHDYFDDLARYTFWSLWVLILLSSFAASTLRRGRLNTTDYRAAPAAFLAVFTLLAHGTQWFWLAEGYGRLRVGVAELRVQGELATQTSSTDFWPFLTPYNEGKSLKPSDQNYDVKVRNIWPIPASGSIQVATVFLESESCEDEMIVSPIPKLDLAPTKDGWLLLRIPKVHGKGNCSIERFDVKDGDLEVSPLVQYIPGAVG